MSFQKFVLDAKLNVPQQLESALAHIKLAESEINAGADLQKDASAQIAKLQADSESQAKAHAEALKAKNAEVEAKANELATVKADLEKDRAELAILRKKDMDAAARAQEIAASQGIPPLSIKPAAPAGKALSEDQIKSMHGREKVIEAFRREREATAK